MAVVSLKYRAPSVLATEGGASTLALSAGERGKGDPFFQGRVLQPRVTARALGCLSRVVGERWFDAAVEARRRDMDPIVTSGDGLLRFEGFSGCRSLYARVDLLPHGLETLHQSHGTTNVDFNQPMRTALHRIRDEDSLSLAVDENAFVLVHGEEAILERKVDLPLAWIKGLASIPVISSTCETVSELTGPAIIALFRSLPTTGRGRDTHWLHTGGRGARIARTPATDAIRLTGAKRLLALQELTHHAEKLTIATNPARDLSLWTLHFKGLRITLALSPEVWRGFSGEGSALADLGRSSNPDLEEALAGYCETGFDADEAAIALGVPLPEIRTSLAVLASQGRLGFDHTAQRWFPRDLPGSAALVRKSNPRLAKAEAWVEAGAVSIEADSRGKIRGKVSVTEDQFHHVALEPDGDARCTCFWFGKFGLARGQCSHILAVRLAAETSK